MRYGLWSVAAGALLLSGAARAQAQPDLVISNVVVVGSTARVLIYNQGSLPSGACWLRLDVRDKTTGQFLGTGVVPAPGLMAGQGTWVSVWTNPAQPLTPNRRLYFYVDPSNQVPESNEINNRFIKDT